MSAGAICLALAGCRGESAVPAPPSSESQPRVTRPTFGEVGIDAQRQSPAIATTANRPPTPWFGSVRFEMVSPSCGVEHTYVNGATGNVLMVEATGGGAGWLDYDADGQWDLYLNQAGKPDQPASPEQPNDRLFRNLGEGQFVEVTNLAGIEERNYGQGVAVGDYDNDGFDDLFVTNVGVNTLYRNQGDGTFRDVTSETVAAEKTWSSSAAWADLDRDGDLDLYVCRYVVYDPFHPHLCHSPQGKTAMCHPNQMEAYPDELFVNNGDGTFRRAATELGLFGPENKALGVAIADFDNDGLADVYVANDSTPNFLFLQQPDGRFTDTATLLGCAVSGLGKPQASMGIAVGDFDRNGLLDLYVTHFIRDYNTLYQNLGAEGFHDQTGLLGLVTPTMARLGFGTVMQDFNQDGYDELLVANGHIDDLRADGEDFEMSPQLFAFNGRRWDEFSAKAGDYFQGQYIGRGVATADFDADGDLDVAIVHQNRPMAVLRNDSTRGHWLNFAFRGRTNNRRGIGCRVTLTLGGRTVMQELAGGTSYCSSHQPLLSFGLGEWSEPCVADVRWTDGARQQLTALMPDQTVIVIEPNIAATGAQP